MRRICVAAGHKVQSSIFRKFVGSTFPTLGIDFVDGSHASFIHTQRRFQAASSEKKFHCSICHKSFRLEMAARVHLQQAHGGDGSIEEGSGSGQEMKSTQSMPLESVQENKTAPVVAQSVAPERRSYRRERLTPTPLNTPDRMIPDYAMEQLLEMWDNVGTKRLGPTFIHSSMILKVFAAKPGDVAQAKSGPLSSSGSRPAAAAATASSSEHIAAYNSDQTIPNPLGGSVVSPFAQEVARSLFAGSVISPFSEASSSASPFSNDTSTAGSPFAPSESPSPFVTGSQAGVAPSPFLPEGAADGSLPTFNYVPSAPSAMPISSFAPMGEAAHSKSFACESCERQFSSYFGLRMHNKDKHGIKLPFRSEEEGHRSSRSAVSTSIPAFIPSPVDLAHTSPFGMKKHMSAWTDTEIAPYAHAVNNIVVMGTVRDVQKVDENTSQVALLVRGDTVQEDETFTLRCFGECHNYVQKNLACDNVVFSSGSLRLLPVYDAKLNKYHTDAVVFVSLPQGILTKL